MNKLYLIVCTLLTCGSAYAQQSDITKNFRDDVDSRVKEGQGFGDLKLSASLWGFYQVETQTGEDVAGGVADVVAKYSIDNFSFGSTVEAQQDITDTTTSEFSHDLGSLYALSTGTDVEDPYLKALWGQYQQDKWKIRVGILNMYSMVDQSYYNSYVTYFMNHSFEAKTFAELQNTAAGIVGKYDDEDYYLTLGVSDGSSTNGEAWDNLRDNDMKAYVTGEVGIKNGEDVYYVNLWHNEKSDKQDAYGAYLSLNHTINKKYTVFGKYALSNHSKIDQHVSIGTGIHQLLYKKDLMLIGTAFSEQDEQWQNTSEIVYRYDWKNLQLSLDFQWIHNPINNKEENNLYIPGVRMRIFI